MLSKLSIEYPEAPTVRAALLKRIHGFNFNQLPDNYWSKNHTGSGSKEWCTTLDYTCNITLRLLLPYLSGDIINLITDYAGDPEVANLHNYVVNGIKHMFGVGIQIYFLDFSGKILHRVIRNRKALMQVLEDSFSYDNAWENNAAARLMFLDPEIKFFEYWRGGIIPQWQDMYFPRILIFQDGQGIHWTHVLKPAIEDEPTPVLGEGVINYDFIFPRTADGQAWLRGGREPFEFDLDFWGRPGPFVDV